MEERTAEPSPDALCDHLRADADPWIGYLVVRHAHPAPWAALIARVAAGTCRLRDADAASEALAAWEAGAVRKVCLRAKEGEWRRLREGLVDLQLDVVVDDALLLLEPRRRATAVEQGLGRLQVCRWTHDDLPDPAPAGSSSGPAPAPAPELGVLDRGEMGVGKQLAQVAHAAQLAHREATPQRRAAWAAAGYAVRPRSCRAADLAALAALPGAAAIHDAGLTEVAPGTLTAVLAG